MFAAGIDVGSTATKAVILKDGVIAGAHVLPTGTDGGQAAEECLREVCRMVGAHPGALGAVVATGYGRGMVEGAARTVTEVTCHARGARALAASAKVVVDVGGQDSKVIRLDDDGMVADFVMNDKCAAGTGRFLEVMAERLGVPLEEFGLRWRKAREAAMISSTCTVFAESEVVSLLSQGCGRDSIIRGLCDAVAQRLAAMVRRVGLGGVIVMTGGVSRNEGIRRSLEERLSAPVRVPGRAQYAGAYGAAIIASELARGSGAPRKSPSNWGHMREH